MAPRPVIGVALRCWTDRLYRLLPLRSLVAVDALFAIVHALCPRFGQMLVRFLEEPSAGFGTVLEVAFAVFVEIEAFLG